MGVRKAGEQSTRTILQNSTGTYMVSIPIELVRELKWKRGQKVVIKRTGKKIYIEDWQE